MARQYVYEYDIVGGPGKFDLMTGFFKRGEQISFRIKKNFGDMSNEVIVCTLNQIGHEDGSCESWIIDGHVNTSGSDMKHQTSIHATYQKVTFHGYYSTRKSGGVMTITVTHK